MDITLCHVRILPGRGYYHIMSLFIHYFYFSAIFYYSVIVITYSTYLGRVSNIPVLILQDYYYYDLPINCHQTACPFYFRCYAFL